MTKHPLEDVYFRSGQVCQVTGNYTLVDSFGREVEHDIIVVEGRRFKPTRRIGQFYRLHIATEPIATPSPYPPNPRSDDTPHRSTS